MLQRNADEVRLSAAVVHAIMHVQCNAFILTLVQKAAAEERTQPLGPQPLPPENVEVNEYTKSATSCADRQLQLSAARAL